MATVPSITSHRNMRRRGEPSQPIAITFHSDTPLTVNSCASIVEDVLQYVLYQRGQIPVPLEGVVREAKRQRQALDAHNLLQEQETSLDVVCRKTELLRQKLHRKRQQWLNKAEKFLQNYNSMRESLRNELESGNVRGVGIILGGSVMTGRESYYIRLPEGYTGHSSVHLPRPQNIGLKLFRTIVTNEALLKVMNRPCGVQRVWVMVQRCCSPTPDNTNTTAPLDDTTTTNNLIPRPDFSQNPRATVVEINVQHTHVTASMDLTPTVGSGIKFQKNMLYKNGINKSLYHNSPCMSHVPSHNTHQEALYTSHQGYKESDTGSNATNDSGKRNMLPLSLSDSSNNTHQEALYTSHQGYKESDTGSKATNDSGKRNILPLSLSDSSDLTYRRPILETPVKTLKGEAIPVVETPVHASVHEPFTPSKQLASQLGTFTLRDGAQDCMWYQVDTLLSGFRDMCAKS